ncbi:Predicted PurR-regulated permease PerM [Micromonospora siamensis]|uniref:Predicted PurR-regulated permease PerM n=1 Tax=Micromonospora siamensis TaxID=299152 RepID=A0A1C5I9E6_9ACTN|nr:Predicted PurR-regulated permease PerM [Micromonospora siamensis]
MRAGLSCGSLLVIGFTVLLAARVVVRLGPVTVAVAAALLVAALLLPVVDALRRIGIPRGLSAFITVLGLLAVLTGPLVLLGARVAGQFGDLGRQLDEGVGRTRSWLIRGPAPLDARQLDQLWRELRGALVDAAPAPVVGASLVAETLGAAALAVVLLFLLLKDGRQMWGWLVGRLPERHRGRADRAGRAGWAAVAGYVRGTVIIAAVDALGVGLALLVVGVPLVLPLALLTFVAAFVPIVGATLAGAAAVLVALVADGPVAALVVLAAVIGVQQVEGNLLQPLIMGRTVRLHPAVILIAVAAGTVLAGVAGAVAAVPLCAAAYQIALALSGEAGPASCTPSSPTH